MSNVEKLDVNKGPSSKAIGKMLRTSPIKLNDAVKSIRGKNCRSVLSANIITLTINCCWIMNFKKYI